MKIRTINEAYAELISVDKNCGLTKYGLRQLVITGEIPSFRRGNRYLIDFDQLLKHLNIGELTENTNIKDVNVEKVYNDRKDVKPHKSRFKNI